MKAAKLICIIGAECTGKTTLARALAAHFACPWVPEHLRDFCDSRGRTPTRDEQLSILETQHLAELAAHAQATQQEKPFVFCDTAPLLTAIYSDFIFGDRSLYDRARALHSNYALTLLLAPNIAWVADGLQRDGAQVRAPITKMITNELGAMGVPLALIVDQEKERIAAAIGAINALNTHGVSQSPYRAADQSLARTQLRSDACRQGAVTE